MEAAGAVRCFRATLDGMNGWRLVGVVSLALLGSASAFAQDSIVTAPKVVPRAAVPKMQPAKQQAVPAAQTAKPAVGDTQVRAAQDMASIAAREAVCLREAAQQVSLAAQRLSAAPPEQADKRRDDLQFALGVMDECRSIARKREQDAAAASPAPQPEDPFAEAPPAVTAPLRALFS